LKFVWNISEPGTGFAFFQLDNIRLNTSSVGTNVPPVVAITSPGNGSSSTVGQSVTLIATGTDTEDGNISGNISWTSNRDGAIGSGGTVSTSALTVGSHTITASVTDSGGLLGSASITITVNPVVTNTAPTAGNQTVSTNEDTPLLVTLSGVDAEQCELQFVVVSGPAKGTLGPITNTGCASGTPNTDTAVLTYTPGANLSGLDSFTYRVSDGSLTSEATVSITINAVNEPPTTMHVGDLDGSSSTVGRGSWRATVSASVHDSNHAALSGATVTGLWSGGASGAGSCTTDATGRCAISSASLANSKKNATFTITSVTNSLTYAASGNHDPDGDSSGGTAITVKKP